MSNEIKTWPTKPFYILSKIDRSNWILTPSNGTMKMQNLNGTIDQLWTAIPDPRGGAILQHVSTGQVLATSIRDLGLFKLFEGLKLEKLDLGKGTELWRIESLGAPWVGINSLLDWEQKINVLGSNVHGTVGLYHWDGGADNEEWQLVDEIGEVTMESITYDLSRAVADLSLPPARNQALIFDNTEGETPLTGSKGISRTVTNTRTLTNSESDTTGTKYTQTFTVKGTIAKVVEVSASASFEESNSRTVSMTDQTANSDSTTDSVTVNINVPPGRRYSYQIVVYYGKATVPYTAQMKFQSSITGASPVRFTTHGVFQGVNLTRNEVQVLDITDRSKIALISHKEVSSPEPQLLAHRAAS